MVDTLARSDQDIDADLARPSKFGRFWLLTIAALDVLLVISSMVALNAALPDIALETNATQGQLTRVVDGYTLVLACVLLPAGAIGDRYGRRGALLAGLLAIWSPGRDGQQLQVVRRLTQRAGSTRDELGGSVTQHDDGGVGAAAGDGRQDRPVDHP